MDWNPYNDELSFASAMRGRLVAAGFDPDIGVVVETSRNGWGGPTRPTGPSTSPNRDVFVDQSRIDRRFSKASYCNQTGAVLGERPTAAPAAGDWFPAQFQQLMQYAYPPL
ncbi:glycoside hydrolase family 6 protein [Solwaraspora sp. WMMD791]|uniref:glycoside hydrolase family 6 protein n=1 Tax=Solwaraspora sp. WMMD791 TaxID=3016086 RepID=UPI00249BFF67|nr:glycoside hydrolase family 6 protein [Solwaraspora sp. WMMD791]WFE30741.1 glycoside hydrolase family 6 protein [Solwaraspora sp. WMMD791]